MNIDQYSPQSGRFVKEDGTTVNIADALGGKSVSDKVYDINNMMPHSGRFIKEDGTTVNIADMIANGDIGGGGGGGSDSGSSDDSAPPIIETYNGQVIQCSMSADRPIKGLNLYATCEQATTTGAQLFDASLIPTTSKGGATVTNNGDGSFTISGEGQLTETFYVAHRVSKANMTLKPGAISISRENIVNSCTPRIFFQGLDSAGGVVINITNQGKGNITASITEEMIGRIEEYVYGFSSAANKTITPATFFPMVYQDGNGTYEPYTGGKPSPSLEYPQEIQTISDFVVEVKNSMGEDAAPQTLDVTIPEQGFYGLAVDSDGNYTDSNNQRWYADCFNYKTKKFVKCIKKTTAIGEKADGTVLVSGFGFASRIATVDTSTNYGMCEKLLWSSRWNTQNEAFTFAKTFSGVDSYDIIATLSHGTLGTTNETTIQNATSAFKTYLSSNPLTFFYVSKTPIEYDLTDAQVEEFENLRSYYGTTYIDNDAVPACNMQAELVLDTKLYIDNKFTTLAGQILEMGV